MVSWLGLNNPGSLGEIKTFLSSFVGLTGFGDSLPPPPPLCMVVVCIVVVYVSMCIYLSSLDGEVICCLLYTSDAADE